MLALERTREYKGVYHVIGGLISPMDGLIQLGKRSFGRKRLYFVVFLVVVVVICLMVNLSLYGLLKHAKVLLRPHIPTHFRQEVHMQYE